jgi:hypothetical protein
VGPDKAAAFHLLWLAGVVVFAMFETFPWVVSIYRVFGWFVQSFCEERVAGSEQNFI